MDRSLRPGLRRWSLEKVVAWDAALPRLMGVNFVPSTASNQLEMFGSATFDAPTIDRELGWAAQLGVNAVRVFLHNLLWESEGAGFLRTVDKFLSITSRHGIGTVLVLLDGVWDPRPAVGRSQRPPRPHVHNSRWVQAPGAAVMGDPTRHDELRGYVEAVLRRFANDSRVLVWDLANEADNSNVDSYGARGTLFGARATELAPLAKARAARELLRKLFLWARRVAPTQPLTAAVYRSPSFDAEADAYRGATSWILLQVSDVLSFHTYEPAANVTNELSTLVAKQPDRPILCSEYLARPEDSTLDPVLGVLLSRRVHAFSWGLVAGKTQTIYPWTSWKTRLSAPPEVWMHDLLRADGTPYHSAEAAYMREQARRHGVKPLSF